MGFSVENSSLVVTHVLYKAALIFVLVRWVLSWALSLFPSSSDVPASPSSSSSSSSSSSWVSSNTMRDSLSLTTFGEIVETLPECCDTCAVCLNRLKKQDTVRELRNCCHVFHKQCIDKWVDHDNDYHKTCPLCRAPLLTSSQSLSMATSEPSWAVERLLYLFGDDLLM